MDNIFRIQRVSRRLRVLCSLLIWGIPMGLIMYWSLFNVLPASSGRQIFSVNPEVDVPLLVRFFGLLLSLVPAGAAIYALAALRSLFGLYLEGKVFTAENVRCFWKVGKALLFWAVASILYTPASTVLVSSSNPPGQRMISVGVSGAEIMAALLGGAILVVSWVMDEGRKLDEDQSLTI